MKSWKKKKELVRIESFWVTMVCEQWIDAENKLLDYWRVEKVDSIIIIPLYKEQLLLPAEQYRPGINHTTLDFPGGRLVSEDLKYSIYLIMDKELGIKKENIMSLECLNKNPSFINSSFSNQKLHVYMAELSCLPLQSYEIFSINELQKKLQCVQCAYALNLYVNLESRK